MASGKSLVRFARFIRPNPALAGLMVVLCVAAISYAQGVEQLILSSEFSSLPSRQPKVVQPIVALKPPALDGVPDDACWMPCAPLELGSEMGGAVTRSTLVRVCYDETALYIAFECQEPSVADLPAPPPPPKPGAPPVELPHDLWSADNVQLRLTFPDEPEEQYLFAVGTTGARFESDLQQGTAWSPAWAAKAARIPGGWSVEMAIPLAAFGDRRIAATDAWQANFARDVGLSGERCSWETTSGSGANPDFWGTMFFGDTQALLKREQPARLDLFPGRWVLGEKERALRMVVRIEPGGIILSKCKLRLRVAGDEAAGVTAHEAAVSAKGERANLILDASLLPIGTFELEADLVDANGASYGLTKIKLRREPETVAPNQAGQFDLLIPDYDVKTRAAESWPMSVGVALPRGAVRDPANVRLLDGGGVEIPCRGSIRGRWPGDGTIRWLTLDFRANLSRGAQKLTVQYGPQVAAKPVLGFTRNLQVRYEQAENIYVVEKGGAWWVNTGELLFKINQARFSGVEQTWVDVDRNGQYDFSEQILNSETGGSGPYIADSLGRVYRLAYDPNFRMQLEEWNELRVVLRGEGRLVKAGAPGDGDMGRCVFRLTAYAGQPFLNAQYTFFFNNLAARTPLSDVGVVEKMDFDFRKRPDALFGIPQGYRRPLKETGPVFMLIPQANEFAVQNLKDPPTVDMRGADPQEWSCAAAPDRGVALCLRDMGRRYPKEFEINPDGRMTVHFWPPHGDNQLRGPRDEVTRRTLGRLDFANTGRWLDLAVPLNYTTGLKDQAGLPELGTVRDMALADPTGVAATYDVLYFFYRGAANTQDIAGICKLFARHPHAVQSTESLAAANVMPDMLPPERAARAASLLDRLLALDAARGPAGGEFNFQDVRRAWLPNEQRWKLEDYWLGTTGDRPGALWLVYLQTGRPDALLAAQRAVRHVMDVDMCHEAASGMGTQADPRRRKIAGGFGDHRTPVHWQSTWRLSDRTPRLRGLLLSYYATGDLFARDMALAWAAAVKESGVPFPGEDGMVFLDNLSELLALDYDTVLLEKLGECADFLFSMPAMIEDADLWVPGLREYLRQTGDPRVAAFLRRTAPAVPRDNLRLLGLLRDMQQAVPSDELDGQVESLVKGYEQQVDKIMAAPVSKDETLTWEDFCSYVFGATVPSRALIPAAAPAAAPPAPVK